MDYLVKIRSVQTPLNGQFSIGANILTEPNSILIFTVNPKMIKPATLKALGKVLITNPTAH